MNKHNIQAGQTVYCLIYSSFHKKHFSLDIEILNVGKTVFKTQEGSFDINTLIHTKNPDCKVFLTDSDRDYYLTDCRLLDALKSMLNGSHYGQYTRKQLCEAENILKS